MLMHELSTCVLRSGWPLTAAILGQGAFVPQKFYPSPHNEGIAHPPRTILIMNVYTGLMGYPCTDSHGGNQSRNHRSHKTCSFIIVIGMVITMIGGWVGLSYVHNGYYRTSHLCVIDNEPQGGLDMGGLGWAIVITHTPGLSRGYHDGSDTLRALPWSFQESSHSLLVSGFCML